MLILCHFSFSNKIELSKFCRKNKKTGQKHCPAFRLPADESRRFLCKIGDFLHDLCNFDHLFRRQPICSLPRKTQKTDTQNEKNAPEHHVQERFLLPINGVSPLFYLFNFSSILATCCKICLSVSLLLVSFSVSSFGLSVVVVAFFENPFSPAALMIAG